ncbi:hypothetical protein BKH41_09235 [Helicobacter sp. 12S02232-10]|uniref:HAD-IB family hydrolase n=1 Tax=Helicobacter sp. 12S02232-10 TaxID=1476197 RepID=UPI000BA603D7|nr:HAD-IB family hydrolase [Helicobacter sp. 12S02232-10]PAF46403.1 hypothetical protein BKH41_09235 [Helicobacter sp. 12S02232-10]
MNIAFFDFDGTISKKDSLFLFVRFLVGKKRFYFGILKNLHILLGFKFGILGNSFAKEMLSRYFFAGYAKKDFLKKCEEFLPVLRVTLKDSALQRIRWHQDCGDKVVLVSASFEEYLKPLCDELNIQCIGTILEVCEGKLSGKFVTLNCYGEQKVKRIKENFDLNHYHKIYAYGDSLGDREMLDLALEENRFYRNFK